MALTLHEKQRQRELEAGGHMGGENDELHNLNVKENEDKSTDELIRIVVEKEVIYGDGWAQKARAALRARGYRY